MQSPQCKIRKCSWRFLDAKLYNQIDYVLVDRRSLPNIFVGFSFRGADYDNDRCLVVAVRREETSVSKPTAQKFFVHRSDVRLVEVLERIYISAKESPHY